MTNKELSWHIEQVFIKGAEWCKAINEKDFSAEKVKAINEEYLELKNALISALMEDKK